jgi:hypothetical protein
MQWAELKALHWTSHSVGQAVDRPVGSPVGWLERSLLGQVVGCAVGWLEGRRRCVEAALGRVEGVALGNPLGQASRPEGSGEGHHQISEEEEHHCWYLHLE